MHKSTKETTSEPLCRRESSSLLTSRLVHAPHLIYTTEPRTSPQTLTSNNILTLRIETATLPPLLSPNHVHTRKSNARRAQDPKHDPECLLAGPSCVNGPRRARRSVFRHQAMRGRALGRLICAICASRGRGGGRLRNRVAGCVGQIPFHAVWTGGAEKYQRQGIDMGW
jgi:hypothetical protein